MHTLQYYSYISAKFKSIEQKGMTFDHDFGYSLPLFFFPPKKGRRKGERIAKIVIESHALLLDHLYLCVIYL